MCRGGLWEAIDHDTLTINEFIVGWVIRRQDLVKRMGPRAVTLGTLSDPLLLPWLFPTLSVSWLQ